MTGLLCGKEAVRHPEIDTAHKSALDFASDAGGPRVQHADLEKKANRSTSGGTNSDEAEMLRAMCAGWGCRLFANVPRVEDSRRLIFYLTIDNHCSVHTQSTDATGSRSKQRSWVNRPKCVVLVPSHTAIP